MENISEVIFDFWELEENSEYTEIAEMVITLLKDFCNNNDIEIILDLPDEETKKIYQKYL